MTLYWEDFKVGETVEMGRHTFTEAEIIEFAQQFDPQPFHTDPVAAKASFFGGLIASGWHTCAVCMRLNCDSYINRSVSLGSPGLDNIRWLEAGAARRHHHLPPHRARIARLAEPAGRRPAALAHRGAEPARRGGDVDGRLGHVRRRPRDAAG